MHKINLLPPRVQHAQHRRRLLRILAAVQVAVLLCIAGALVFVRVWESRMRERSAQLTREIAAVDRAPLEAYEAARAAANLHELALAFIYEEFPPAFDPAWLDAVLDAVPSGVVLRVLDFAGAHLTLAASAPSFTYITAHMRLLTDTERFESVRLGATARQADGSTRYELRLMPPASAP